MAALFFSMLTYFFFLLTNECSNTPGTAAMGLLEECYDVLRDNKDAKILLDDLGVRVAEDLRLLDEEDLYPHAHAASSDLNFRIACEFSTAPG